MIEEIQLDRVMVVQSVIGVVLGSGLVLIDPVMLPQTVSNDLNYFLGFLIGQAVSLLTVEFVAFV